TRNTMKANAGPGIKLDGEANDDINTPTLASAKVTETGVEVTVTLDRSGTLEFFLTGDAANSDDEGKVFLQAFDEVVPGEETFALAAQPDLVAGAKIVATLTDGSGNTSEFAQYVEVPFPPAVVYVDDDAVDNSGDGSEANPFRTITYALTKVAEEGTIHVAAGTYSYDMGEISEHGTMMISKKVNLLGAGREATTILTQSGFYITADCSIEGFSLIKDYSTETSPVVDVVGGSASLVDSYVYNGGSRSGARVVNFQGDGGLISNCEIKGRNYQGTCLEIFVNTLPVRIEDSYIHIATTPIAVEGARADIIIDNNRIEGFKYHGIDVNNGDTGPPVVIRSNLIQRRTIDDNDLYAGIYLECRNAAAVNIIDRNTIVDTSIGIRLDRNAAATIKNNIIACEVPRGNTTRVTSAGIVNLGDGDIVAEYNCLYLNDYDYSNVTPGEGNITSSPYFVDPDANDFRLAENSPARDAGHPDDRDPDDTRADMGRYYDTYGIPHGVYGDGPIINLDVLLEGYYDNGTILRPYDVLIEFRQIINPEWSAEPIIVVAAACVATYDAAQGFLTNNGYWYASRSDLYDGHRVQGSYPEEGEAYELVVRHIVSDDIEGLNVSNHLPIIVTEAVEISYTPGLYDKPTASFSNLDVYTPAGLITALKELPGGTKLMRGGDLNNDNRVNVLDYGVWRGAVTTAGTIDTENVNSILSDINGDGKINVLDYAIWLGTAKDFSGQMGNHVYVPKLQVYDPPPQ
ncbi:DUF1565 domain-containing protein, partial [Candidatus Margulisiibacteriota bacterium]